MSISRIDHPPRNTYGYYVRVRRDGVLHAKFFGDRPAGGKRKAKRLARDYEAELIAELDAAPRAAKRPAPGRRNSSGTVGVSRAGATSGDRTVYYWQAHWTDETGRRRGARFSVDRYGEEKARKLAVKARRAAEAAR